MLMQLAMASANGTTTEGGGGGYEMLLMVGVYAVIIVGFYFIFLRPQKKRQKKEEEMRNNVQVGDEIITVAGVYGRVVAIKEDSLIIESGPDRSKQRVARWAVQQNLTVHED